MFDLEEKMTVLYDYVRPWVMRFRIGPDKGAQPV